MTLMPQKDNDELDLNQIKNSSFSKGLANILTLTLQVPVWGSDF